MEVKVNRTQLLALLGKVGSALPRKTHMTVLYSYRLEAAKGKLMVSASDLESQLSGAMKARVSKPGGILLPPEALAFIKASTAEYVSIGVLRETRKRVVEEQVPCNDYFLGKSLVPPFVIVQDYNGTVMKKVSRYVTRRDYSYKVQVSAGKATSAFNSMGTEDYPPVVTVKGKPIKVSKLATAIGQVFYATAKEDSRPVLQGICFTPKKGKIELAAADGFRMGITSIPCQGRLPAQVVLDRTIMALAQKCFKDRVTLRAEIPAEGKGDPKVSFEGDGLVLVAKTIHGTFPDYQQLIPKKGRSLVVKTTELAEAVKMAMSIKPINGIVRLESTSKGLKVLAYSEGNKAESILKAEGKAKIAFNGRYLAEVIGLQPEKKFTLRSVGPGSPALIPINGTVHVLMPMFVQDDVPKAYSGVTSVTMRPVVGTNRHTVTIES